MQSCAQTRFNRWTVPINQVFKFDFLCIPYIQLLVGVCLGWDSIFFKNDGNWDHCIKLVPHLLCIYLPIIEMSSLLLNLKYVLDTLK